MLSQTKPQQPTVAVSCSHLRVEFDGLSEIAESSMKIVLPAPRRPTRIISPCQAGLECDCALKIIQSAINIAVIQVGPAAIAKELGAARVQPDGFIKICKRFYEIAFVHPAITARVVRLRISRILP